MHPKLLYIYTLIIFNLLVSTLFAQEDSVVFVYDTIYLQESIKTIDFNAPVNYNLIGINQKIGNESIRDYYHYKSYYYSCPEVYINIARGKYGYELGLSSNTHKQYLRETYLDSKTVTTPIYYFNINTFFISTVKDSINYIMLYDKETIQSTDTILTNSEKRGTNIYRSINIPIRLNYFFNHNYLRIAGSIGIIPHFNFNQSLSSEINYPVEINNKISFSGETRLTASYWIFDRVFVHSNLYFSHEFTKGVTIIKSKEYTRDIGITLGLSYLIWDEIWE